MDVARQFEELLPLIDRVVASTNRRHALSEDEGEEFSSWLKLRLIESDYAALRKFRGNSSLRTYLVVVVKNLFQDYRVAKWGKWRPSALAKRAGDVGVQLESLLFRDGRTLAEAIEILENNLGVVESRAELERLAAKLRPRFPRRFEGEHSLRVVASSEPTPLERAENRAREPRVRALEESLRALVDSHDDLDRTILQLRFGEGLKIVDIARSLGLEQRSLYGRIERLLRGLRRRLEGEGFTAEEVVDLLRWTDLELNLALEDLRPSTPEGTGAAPQEREVLQRVRLPT